MIPCIIYSNHKQGGQDMDRDKIEVCLEVMQETERAFRLRDDNDNYGQWMPKSQLDHGDDVGVGDTAVFEMPEWLAFEKGFI
jgi:hypothetical protein